MCRAVTCTTCGKTTWAGCGRHVDAVRAKVPDGQWCGGHDQASASRSDTDAKPSLFSRLFGR